MQWVELAQDKVSVAKFYENTDHPYDTSKWKVLWKVGR